MAKATAKLQLLTSNIQQPVLLAGLISIAKQLPRDKNGPKYSEHAHKITMEKMYAKGKGETVLVIMQMAG